MASSNRFGRMTALILAIWVAVLSVVASAHVHRIEAAGSVREAASDEGCAICAHLRQPFGVEEFSAPLAPILTFVVELIASSGLFHAAVLYDRPARAPPAIS